MVNEVNVNTPINGCYSNYNANNKKPDTAQEPYSTKSYSDMSCNKSDIRVLVAELIKKYNIDFAIISMYCKKNINNESQLDKKSCNAIYELLKKYDFEKNPEESVKKFEKDVKYDYYIKLIGKERTRKEHTDDMFFEAAENAIKDATDANGNFNQQKALKLYNAYYTALYYRWDSVEDFKKAQERCSDGLLERAKEWAKNNKKTHWSIAQQCKGYLEDLKKYLEKELEKKVRGGCTREEASDWYDKMLKQTFGKLIVNTRFEGNNNKNIEIIKEVLKSVSNADRQQLLDDILNGIRQNVSDETATQIASGLAKDKDFWKKHPELIKIIAKYAGEEGKQHILNSTTTELLNFMMQHGAQIQEIEKKIKSKIVLQDDEVKIWNNFQSYIQNNTSSIEGIYISENIDTDKKVNMVAENSTKLQNESEIAYRYQMQELETRISNYDISEDSKNQARAFFNKVTNGNYLLLMKNPKSELNPPLDVKSLSKNVGFDTIAEGTKECALTNIKTINGVIEQQSLPQNQNEEFEVVLNTDSSEETICSESNNGSSGSTEIIRANEDLSNITVNEVINALKNCSLYIDDLMKQYSDLSQKVQQLLITRLTSLSAAMQVQNINRIDKNSDKVDVARDLDLATSELENLNLDFNNRKLLDEHVA